MKVSGFLNCGSLGCLIVFLSASALTAIDAEAHSDDDVGTFMTGGWTGPEHIRTLGKIDNDAYPEIVAFGADGVYVSRNLNGSFAAATKKFEAFSPVQTWKDSTAFPRVLADVNADGRDDIIGFTSDGVYVSTATGGSNEIQFRPPTRWVLGFSHNKGWLSNDTEPRMAADVNGDGFADLVGFSGNGVYVALNNKASTPGEGFATTTRWLNAFGSDADTGGWTSQLTTPRMVIDVNADRFADIVGFGSDGVYVALNNKADGFSDPARWLDAFSVKTGWPNSETNPRTLSDVTGDGYPDIVGFASDGVYVAVNNKSGSFDAPIKHLGSFGASDIAGGWASNSKAPRFVIDVNGDSKADIVGFGDTGVWIALNTGNSFSAPRLNTRAYGNGKLGILPGWMTSTWDVLNNLSLSQVSMPGSHDSLTYCCGTIADIWKTQSDDIASQLDAGARFFDLNIAGDYYLYGRDGRIEVKVADVFRQFVAFLRSAGQEHEIIVVQVHPLSGYADFKAQIDATLGADASFVWHPTEEGHRSAPQTLMKDIAKRVIVYTPLQVGWRNTNEGLLNAFNTWFEYANMGVNLFRGAGDTGPYPKMLVLSAACTGLNPYTMISSGWPTAQARKFRDLDVWRKRRGLLVKQDYVTKTPDLNRAIIESNFPW